MGVWSEKILGNDIAMDMICVIEDEYNKLDDFEEVLEVCKDNNNYRYTEGKLAIAYVELFITGSIHNKQEILEIIKAELSEDNLDNWIESSQEKRVQILQEFKTQIINSKLSNIQKSENEIKEWFEKMHDEDIL